MRRLLVLQVPSPPSGNPSPSIGRGKARAVTPDEFEPSNDDAEEEEEEEEEEAEDSEVAEDDPSDEEMLSHSSAFESPARAVRQAGTGTSALTLPTCRRHHACRPRRC